MESTQLSNVILFPRPRRVEVVGGDGARASTNATLLADSSLGAEGFAINVDGGDITLRYGGPAGKRYGAQTLEQLTSQLEILPAMSISDSPDFGVRGYMLDISRDRVPTMQSLFELVDLLSFCRFNQLQLYTEHTFAYASHEAVWRTACPMTATEVRELDSRCADVGIELVANQNTFGHMERWLALPEYAERAEAPEGFDTKIGVRMDPGTLEPTVGNAEFVVELCEELLSHHTSKRLNIGCDETFELGRGRTKDRCESETTQVVYLEHLNRIIDMLLEDGKSASNQSASTESASEVIFWGDVLRGHPELAAKLPKDRVTALVWHYEAPTNSEHISDELLGLLSEFGFSREALSGFDFHIESFENAGVPFWVCPGTSSWNSLIGRIDNARANLLDASRSGLARGATGFLLTDWGDNGHHQPPSISASPLVYGGAVSWCADANVDLDLASVLDRFVFEDESGVVGALLDRIGRMHTATGVSGLNSSPFFNHLISKGSTVISIGEAEEVATVAVIEAMDLELERLDGLVLGCRNGEQVVLELRAAIRLARHGAWRLAKFCSFEVPSDQALADDLTESMDLHRQAWLGRSRPCGLAQSLARLERTLRSYEVLR